MQTTVPQLPDQEQNAPHMNSMTLGEVIEVDEQRHAGFWKNTAINLSIVVSLGALMCFYPQAPLRFSIALSICVSAIGIGFVTFRFWDSNQVRAFRIHENGVSIVDPNASTEILFCELESYTCKKKQVQLIFFELELKSNSLDDPQTIEWTSSAIDPAVDFDELHIRISQKVADNLAAMLELKGRVPWGSSSFICNDGVEVREKTGFISSQMRHIAWSEIHDIKFRDAKLVLRCGSEHCIEIHCAEPNLFAGFLLVDRKMKDLFGDWMAHRQSVEEMAKAMTDVHPTVSGAA